jgi:hypothetical protein
MSQNNVSVRVYRIHLGSCDYWRTQTVCSIEVEELPMHEKTCVRRKETQLLPILNFSKVVDKPACHDLDSCGIM